MDAHPLRILLVEDNPADADAVLGALDARLFEVVHAGRLEEALGALARRAMDPVDAIVLDLNLPDSSGLATLCEIREAADGVPIVVASGILDDALRADALREGAEDCVDKVEIAARLPRSIPASIERNRGRTRMAKLVSAMPDAIIVTSRRTDTILFVNAAARRLFGVSGEELVGEQWMFSASKGPAELELVRGGGKLTLELRVVTSEWDGEPAWLAVIRDNTELRQMQAQLMVSDRMASVGALAAGVAHEINNPLAVIVANLEIAIPEIASLAAPSDRVGDLQEALEDAREAADRVRAIVKDLCIFSRAEEDLRGPVDLHRVLDSTLRMAITEIRHRARLVKCYGEVPSVLANESRLGQVFLNLLVNAAQAIPEGLADSNEIRVTTRTDAAGRVLTEIRDTGAGIPKDQLDTLFTPFRTTKPAGAGMGLGMAISQRIVTELGGEIMVDSEVGVGTTFAVALPAARAVAHEAPATSRSSRPNARRGRILLVDDDQLVADAVRRSLGKAHDVVVCSSAREALDAEVLGGPPFDVILCDLMMPVVTGMDYYLKLCDVAPALAERVVFLSGGAFTARAREFLDHVPNARLDKPFRLADLRDLVDGRIR